MIEPLSPSEAASVGLLQTLKALNYRFVTPGRDTYHANRLRRALDPALSLADLFGWNRRVPLRSIDPEITCLMNAGELLASLPFGRCQSRIACGTLGDVPLLHSSLSRRSIDTVFFGPDSYRFASFLQRQAHKLSADARVVDVGTGTGVGAVALLQRRPDLRVVLSDISATALRLARINLTASHMAADYVQSDGLLAVAGQIDVVIANPPYLGGGIGRTYRKGGGCLGAGLAIDWVQQAAQRLQPGGSILLYTGSAIVDGRDTVREAIVPTLRDAGYDVAYEEVDPDIFGGTLWLPAYWNVDRIAAVTMVATKSERGPPIDMRGRSG